MMHAMKGGTAMTPAARTYVIQFSAAMAAYVVAVVASAIVLNAYADAPWRAVVALVPVIPALFGLLAFLRFLARMDELQQRIQLTAIGFSFGATAMLTFAYGFLQNAGFPAISWVFILPGMVALWGVGVAFASWRYR